MAEQNVLVLFWNSVWPSLSVRLPELAVITLTIALYGVLVYKYYHFLAKRDVFGFDIKKYYEDYRGFKRAFFSTLLGIFKYGLVFPVIVFVWFAGFAIILSLLAKNLPVDQLVVMCITFVAGIRVTAYYTEMLSRDLAKLVPLALLAVSIAEPNFVSLPLVQQRIAGISLLVTDLLAFFLFIILVEWMLRILLFFKHSLLGVDEKEINNKEE